MRTFHPWMYSLPRLARRTGVRSTNMSSLRDLQRQFVGALFDELPDTRAGLEIYRNNLHEGFCKVLALEFPVIQRLVGADYFRQLGRDFLHAHPSRGGDLHAIGAP